MIAGEGIPIDSVVADFIAGAAELLSPEADPAHIDVVEGQGSVFHPGYAGVSLGLLHGSQPDAFVVCHDPLREHVAGWPHYPLPALPDVVDMHLRLGRRTNPGIRCIGVAVNTSRLAPESRRQVLDDIVDLTGLPAADPLLDGCAAFVRRFLEN
jgi:uncharacterized NAD-dependent epimerase/dehydratase family protein